MISPNQVSRVAGLFGGMGATPDPAVPADPRQRTAMQQMGVTNPLLQQFGRSVAGLFGKADQMASPMQQANRAMQGLDPSKPESLLQVARALESSDPEKAVALRAKAAELVSAQRQLQQEQQSRQVVADAIDAAPVQDEAKKQALKQGVLSGTITPNQAYKEIQVLTGQFQSLRAGGASSTIGGTKAGTWKDEDGNVYEATRILDRATGETRIDYAPIGHNKEYNNQTLTEVTGDTGLSFAEKQGVKDASEIAVDEAKKWSDLRIQAATELPSLAESVQNIDKALELLDKVDTGGPINTAGTALESFLGTMSADKAELQVILGNDMYQRLKPLFGGVISDSEAKVVERLYADLKKGNAANTGILRNFRAGLVRAYNKGQQVRRADSLSGYNALVDKLYPESFEEAREAATPTVNWNDL